MFGCLTLAWEGACALYIFFCWQQSTVDPLTLHALLLYAAVKLSSLPGSLRHDSLPLLLSEEPRKARNVPFIMNRNLPPPIAIDDLLKILPVQLLLEHSPSHNFLGLLSHLPSWQHS